MWRLNSPITGARVMGVPRTIKILREEGYHTDQIGK
jgi:hypothetical protein